MALIQKVLKVIEGFTLKKYRSDNPPKRLHINNQENCI